MINKKKFKKIIKIASQPLFSQPIKQDLKKAGKKKAYNYNGKRTRQHKVVNLWVCLPNLIKQ